MSANSSEKRNSRKSMGLERSNSSKKQEAKNDSPKIVSRQRSKTSLSKQSSDRSIKLSTLSSPSLDIDEDVPDDVSLTLVEQSHEAALDSPMKRSLSLESDSKQEPDLIYQIEHNSRNHSIKDINAQMVSTGSSVPQELSTQIDVLEHLPPLSLSTPSRDNVGDETLHKVSISLPSNSATPSKKNSDEVHSLPAISPAHIPHSAKSPSMTPHSADSKHRSKSMFVSQNNISASSLQSGDASASAGSPISSQQSPLFSPFDKKLSPSEKFRSFMKNFTLDRGDGEDSGEIGDGFGKDESMKASGSSKKVPLTPEEEAKRGSQLKARIARVQEEQAKFRRNQNNMRASFSVSTKGGPLELVKEKSKKVKIVNKGKAPSYNGNSILAGLKKAEFRATLEAGAAALKVHQRLSEDLFNEHSMPIGRLHKGGINQVSTHNIDRASLAMAGFYRAPSEHSMTLSGEGYMSDEDWRITNRYHKDRRSLSLQNPDKTSRISPLTSNHNLEALMEASLREHSAMFTVSDDCPDKPDVPLSYLQSSNLIERRFGWEAKDYSAPKQEIHSRHKSWMTLRGVVHGAGAFTLAAAAAAYSGQESPESNNSIKPFSANSSTGMLPVESGSPTALPTAAPSGSPVHTEQLHSKHSVDNCSAVEPAPDAPVIVLKETPVHEFVTKLVHANYLQPRSTDECDEISAATSITSPTKVKFVISKEVPQIITLKKGNNPSKHTGFVDVKPKTMVIAKDDLKSAKMKANTKEFHDRYNGLIFRDTSQPKIWQDTEDLILGKVRPHTNSVLNARSDMRWAGKTLNMYRPWSAARQEDAIDKFLHEQALHRANSTFSMASGKSSPGRAGSPNSASGNGGFFGASSAPLPRIDSMSIGSSSAGGGVRARSLSPSSSVTGAGSISAHGTRNRSVSPPGSVSMGGGSSHPHAVSGDSRDRPRKRVDSQLSSSGGDAPRQHSEQSSSLTGSVTFGNVVINSGKTHHAFEIEDDVDSVLTPHSSHHHHQVGRRSSNTKRTPLLINLVKKLPSA